MPIGVLSLAIEPKTAADQEKLAAGLGQLLADDPALRVTPGRTTIIWAASELHLEVVVDRLKREFGVEAAVGRPRVAYKETVTRDAEGQGRYIAQTGARGQYGHVKIRVRPRTPGTGCAFVHAIVNGVIPSRFIASIDEGLREAMTAGVLAGYPVDDVEVGVYDGSYHDVDSNDASFRIAAAMAFRDAMTKAAPILLEPVMQVDVVTPEEYLGDILGDLNRRRGVIQSIQPHDHGNVRTVSVRMPVAEMFGYQTDLRARARGRAYFTSRFDSYEPCSTDLDSGNDDDRVSPVRAPRSPSPDVNGASISLPEPTDDVD